MSGRAENWLPHYDETSLRGGQGPSSYQQTSDATELRRQHPADHHGQNIKEPYRIQRLTPFPPGGQQDSFYFHNPGKRIT